MGSLRIAAIIVAAGRGHRASRGGDRPKQYVAVGGEAILTHTLRAFCSHPRLSDVVCVIHPDDYDHWSEAAAGIAPPVSEPVTGAATRQGSVLSGLESLSADPPDYVLVHDAARPFVEAAVIDRVVAALARCDGAIPALPLTDTLKKANAHGVIEETVPRAGLWRAQTPQGFRFAPLLAAHRKAAIAGIADFTDDAAIAEWAGLDVLVVEGSQANKKITTAEDIDMANRDLSGHAWPDVRTGTGFDVHRFAPGDHVWLGGIRIDHVQRLDGHSDADVGLHALTDALLGAIGDGDIGQHFPPSDPQWKGAASHLFLRDAVRRIDERGGRIANVDLTILCEAPRIGPHRDAMRTAIAGILGIAVERVGVKATTTEQLGFTGRREGIAAMASATVVLPGALG